MTGDGTDAPADPAACFALASRLLDRGDVAGAGALADAMAADRVDTAWLRARVAMARGEAGIAHQRLAGLLREARLTDPQRAEALLLLGLALEDLGRDAAAFAAAAEGKRLQRAAHADEAGGREGEVARLRRLEAWLATAAVDWRKAPAPADIPGAAATHVFLLGFPRSGTTLLEQMLAAHPDVRTLEEEPTLAVAFQAFLADAGACAALGRLGAAEAAAWAGDYWRRVRARVPDVPGRTFVDKQPAGTLHLPLIARLFPRARILFALRDPRDVVLSSFRQAFRLNAMTYAFTDLRETAACYDACMGLAERARALLPLAWLDVRHEALVADRDGVLAEVAAFLGLAPSAAMGNFVQTARTRPIRTPSAPQVRAGLNRRGLGRWRRFERELAPVLPVLALWVERFGYPP